MSLLLGYNTRNTKWWYHDITTTNETQRETTTTIYGLQQLIDEPNHIHKNRSSCIDLIFIHQSNLIVNSGTLLFMTIVNTKLILLRPGLEMNTLHLINLMSVILPKLTLM